MTALQHSCVCTSFSMRISKLPHPLNITTVPTTRGETLPFSGPDFWETTSMSFLESARPPKLLRMPQQMLLLLLCRTYSKKSVHRPAEGPRRSPFPAAESLVAPARPFPTKDAFSIDGSIRNTIGAFFVASFHGTRSHDRGTPPSGSARPAGGEVGLNLADAQASSGGQGQAPS